MADPVPAVIMDNDMEERALQEELIVNAPLPYTRLFAREWYLYPPDHSNLGKGDLVFQRPGFAEFLVVETKHLNTSTGHSACAHRIHGRKKVREQAVRYGKAWKEMHPFSDVEYATYTNVDGLKFLRYGTSQYINDDEQ
jgi:hypothetical protein